MIAKRFAFAFVAILSGISVAEAQKRYSGWEPDTSLQFERTLEPSVYVGTPEACREICLKEKRCTGWTYYHPEFTGEGARETWEPLRGACFMGTAIGRNMQKAPGLTSGMVSVVWDCPPPSIKGHQQYVC
jgi:hypothetical protein